MEGQNPSSVPPVLRPKSTAEVTDHVRVMIGEPAPQISVSTWLVGEPLEELIPGRIHVVEFWSSWCGPCQQIMPHLSSLQQKYPDVVFLSVAVWERDPAHPSEFLESLGQSVTHRVAIDLPLQEPIICSVDESTPEYAGKMAHEWLLAAGEQGVPTCFLIDLEGRIAWIGHPAELDKVLPDLIAGKLVVDKTIREQTTALMRLETNPTAEINSSIFENLFERRAPSLNEAQLDWLRPEPKTAAAEPAEKQSGLFGRFLGRGKEKEAVKPTQQAGQNVYGPPPTGRAYGLILLPMVGSDSITPGWESLDEPMINTLPQFFKQADFVAVISGTAPIEELYDHDYRRQLADWGAELGWRMGFEIAQQNEAEDTHQEDLPESSLNPENESPYLNFWMETFSQNETPFAAFVDESGKILWFGSPLRLVEAVTRWNKGELTPKWAASDLVFWYRLVASAAANERMAGAHVGRVFEGITTDGPNIEDDSVMLDVWEKTIESLNAQLPWRAHRWRVFEFRIATAKARQARHSAEMTAHVMDQFRKLTELFEESAPFSAVYLEDWKNVIKIAMDYMGLTSDSLHQPLDSSGLLALEGHPLTGLILDSVIRHDASIHDVSDMFMFQPRLSPAVFFKFNRFEEAVAEQQKMIDMFDAYARHQLQFMSSGDREDDQELTPEMLSESFLKMLLGEPPAQYRENLVKLRDHYQKFVEES